MSIAWWCSDKFIQQKGKYFQLIFNSFHFVVFKIVSDLVGLVFCFSNNTFDAIPITVVLAGIVDHDIHEPCIMLLRQRQRVSRQRDGFRRVHREIPLSAPLFSLYRVEHV